MDNVGKNWDSSEEEKLINQINKLEEMDKICQIHKRQIGGIRARIKKIIDDPFKSNKIKDKADVIIKYFSTDNSSLSKEEYIKIKLNIKKNIFNYSTTQDISLEHNINNDLVIKILNSILKKEEDEKINKKINKILKKSNYDDDEQIKNNIDNKNKINNKQNSEKINFNDEDEIINNIKEFSSVFMIKKVYNNYDIGEIIDILKNYIKSESCEAKKKELVKSILKKYKMCKEEDSDDERFDVYKYKNKCKNNLLINNKSGEKIINQNINQNINKTFFGNNGSNPINNPVDNSEIKKVLEFLKELKHEITDLKSEIFDVNIKINDVLKKINKKHKSKRIKENNINRLEETDIDVSNDNKNSNQNVNSKIFLSPNHYKELSNDSEEDNFDIKHLNKVNIESYDDLEKELEMLGK